MKGTALPWSPRASKPRAMKPEVTQARLQELVRSFTLRFPIGTKVRYSRKGEKLFESIGFLRSRAALLSDGTPAVQIAGIDGWVPLAVITPLDPPLDGAKAAVADFSGEDED